MIGGTMETVGLLAGIGILPVEFIEAAHMQGYKVVCIAVIPGTEKELKEKADTYYEVSVFKLNKVIKNAFVGRRAGSHNAWKSDKGMAV